VEVVVGIVPRTLARGVESVPETTPPLRSVTTECHVPALPTNGRDKAKLLLLVHVPLKSPEIAAFTGMLALVILPLASITRPL
jgi:hypothetical protein